jgi:hypothetical protein
VDYVDYEVMSRFSDQPPLPGSRTRLAAWDGRLASLGPMLKGIVGWGLLPLSLLIMLLIVATQADSVLLSSQGHGTPGQFTLKGESAQIGRADVLGMAPSPPTTAASDSLTRSLMTIHQVGGPALRQQ